MTFTSSRELEGYIKPCGGHNLTEFLKTPFLVIEETLERFYCRNIQANECSTILLAFYSKTTQVFAKQKVWLMAWKVAYSLSTNNGRVST